MNCLDNNFAVIPTQHFRIAAGLHQFKSLALGDLHVAGLPQWASLSERIQWLDDRGDIDERTWSSWFSATPAMPQSASIELLNCLASRLLERLTLRDTQGWDPAAFSELILGGLMRSLAKRIRARSPHKVLLCRASDYQGLSAPCCHFDAIDVAAWSADAHGISGAAIKRLAAQAILARLECRWERPHGHVYREFPSPLKRRWENASISERKKIREIYARTQPDLFDTLLSQGDCPDWDLTGVRETAPIWECLFALAADSTFLRHEDVLAKWALDLVTAGFAEHALALADSPRCYSGRMSREFMIATTTYQCFFSPHEEFVDSRLIRAAMSLTEARWTEEAFDVLRRARAVYHSQLREWHISPSELWLVASSSGNPFHSHFVG